MQNSQLEKIYIFSTFTKSSEIKENMVIEGHYNLYSL